MLIYTQLDRTLLSCFTSSAGLTPSSWLDESGKGEGGVDKFKKGSKWGLSDSKACGGLRVRTFGSPADIWGLC